MDKVNVVLTGKLLANTDFANAVKKMVALTRLDQARVERLLSSGQPTAVKKEVSRETGEKYRLALTGIGVEVELQAIGAVDASVPAALHVDTEPQAPPPPLVSSHTIRNNGEHQHEQAQYSHCVPEAAPLAAEPAGRGADEAASRSTRYERQQTPTTAGNILSRKVPASHGWEWIKQAVDIYMEAQFTWTCMVLMLSLLAFFVSKIPVAGSLLTTLFSPVFAGGLMLAAAGQQQGNAVAISDLFQGFRKQRNQLLFLGLFHLLFAFLIGILVAIGMVLFFKGGNLAKNPAFLLQHGLAAVLMLLVVLLLAIPAGMASWFAPCLVTLEKHEAWESLKLSFFGALKNWPSFLVYSLVLLLASVVVGGIVSLVGGFLGMLLPEGVRHLFISLLILLLASPTIAVFTLTSFTGYRDIFHEE